MRHNMKSGVDLRRYGRHLEKSIWRHNFAAISSILMKFGIWTEKSCIHTNVAHTAWTMSAVGKLMRKLMRL